MEHESADTSKEVREIQLFVDGVKESYQLFGSIINYLRDLIFFSVRGCSMNFSMSACIPKDFNINFNEKYQYENLHESLACLQLDYSTPWVLVTS